MYSMAYRLKACEDGYHTFQESGDKLTARKKGYGEPGIAWCWYTGKEAARTKQSLAAAKATVRMGDQHG